MDVGTAEWGGNIDGIVKYFVNPGSDPGFDISAEVSEAYLEIETSPNLATCSNCTCFHPKSQNLTFNSYLGENSLLNQLEFFLSEYLPR